MNFDFAIEDSPAAFEHNRDKFTLTIKTVVNYNEKKRSLAFETTFHAKCGRVITVAIIAKEKCQCVGMQRVGEGKRGCYGIWNTNRKIIFTVYEIYKFAFSKVCNVLGMQAG